jgi:hypothetical protein
VIVKATAGGGGRGMKLARTADELDTAFRTARSEAKAAFGNDEVYLEKYLGRPRHIEVQVFGDGKGGAVHLGERDCSLQRRHQKVLEEAPGPSIDAETRARIGATCAEAVAGSATGAGTIEFLYEDGEFYFIEMNTRLQVEHPVTEAIFGVDLVREQIQVASRHADVLRPGRSHQRPRHRGPDQRREAAEFAPSPGLITQYHAPGGLGVRMDSALYDGYRIPPYYDSLIAKLIVRGAMAATGPRRWPASPGALFDGRADRRRDRHHRAAVRSAGGSASQGFQMIDRLRLDRADAGAPGRVRELRQPGQQLGPRFDGHHLGRAGRRQRIAPASVMGAQVDDPRAGQIGRKGGDQGRVAQVQPARRAGGVVIGRQIAKEIEKPHGPPIGPGRSRVQAGCGRLRRLPVARTIRCTRPSR